MSTLGKVLVFLNLVAAGGLFYFAVEDWSKRQAVSETAVRFVLHRDGLPVDGRPADGTVAGEGSVAPVATLPGGVPVDSLPAELLATYFKGIDGGNRFIDSGPPPATQLAEVERVRAKFDTLMSLATDTAKLALLCGQFETDGTFTPGWLANGAASFEERDLVRRLANPATADLPGVNSPADAANKAVELLNRKFEAVLNPPDSQLAQRQADEVTELKKPVEAAATPLANALDELDRATAEAAKATTTAMAAPTDAAARSARTQAESRVKEAAEQVRLKEAELRQAREPLYDALARPKTTAARDAGDRRRRIAHLLIFLDNAAAWQQRVARVVGLTEYAAALSAQADRLADITWALEQQVRADQGLFIAEYEQLKQLAKSRQDILDQQTLVTAGLSAQEAKDRENLNERTEQLNDRQRELDAIRKTVADQLAAQKAVEDQLFQVQRQVGQALTRNFDLEDQLEKAERTAVADR